MTVIRISRDARGTIKARLDDPAYGFNACLTAQLADAGITILPKGFLLPIDFGATSKNFFQSDVSPDDFVSTTAYTLPLMTLFSVSAQNQNLDKFRVFAGVLQIGINVHLSWMASRALSDMETIADCIEEAMVNTFNGSTWAVTNRMVWNGEISLQRSKLTPAEDSWRQSLFFRLTCENHS